METTRLPVMIICCRTAAGAAIFAATRASKSINDDQSEE